MSDRRRLVTVDQSAGTVSTVRDFENGSTYRSVGGSWVVTPGQRKPTMAQSQRRYGGSRQTGETHENGTIGWTVIVNGSTADIAMANVEAMIGDLESMAVGRDDMRIEWRPDGETASTYYVVRGPATWQPAYDWKRWVGAGSIPVDIKIPVAPLAELAAYTISLTGSTLTLPTTVALSTAILGTAPARARLGLDTSGGAAAPIWALIGWTKRPTTPLASSVAPFGIIEAETGTSLSGWASSASGSARGGNMLLAATSGAGTASALWAVDPSTLTADDFSPGEISVDVWARIVLDQTVVSPRLTLSLEPFAGTSYGAPRYAAPFGSAGKMLTLPTAGSFRFVRLGSIVMPVNAALPLKYNLKALGSWATGSTGGFGLDYLVLVPSRQCALSPSSKPNDASYPKFVASTGTTTKFIDWDLSGSVSASGGNPGRDAGLGGSLIELPPGNVDLLLKLSSLVADDPTVDTTSEQLAHTGITGGLRVTPRVYLAG